MLKVFRRFVIISFVSAILTMAVFVSFNTPRVVKADVIAGVALGAGCLAALLASSLAVAGVQITNTGGSESYVEGWYNDIVNSYKQADIEHQEMVDTYFDENGVYIGSEEDLQFVLSDQAYGYWQMGKGVNSLMEDIKSWFVNTFGLEGSSVSSPVVITDNSGYIVNGSLYPAYPDTSLQPSGYPFNNLVEIIPCQNGSYPIVFEGLEQPIYVNVSLGQNSYGQILSITCVYSGYVVASNTFQNLRGYPGTYKFILNFGDQVRLALVAAYQDGYSRMGFQDLFTINYLDYNSISVEGALTDGYQDYQDALNQDLANEEDNENAVVQVGVGALPGVLTGEQVVADILEQATANTLEGTYEGVYENQEEATEDKEGEKEFVPELPAGWVVVNGLEDFFPFCIPYDFYALVSFFDATPEAPKFEFDIELGGVLGTHHVELDFAAFDTVARIFRITVVIGFIVFLVLATRSRFIRG